MPHVMVTGGPGVGKTTLLAELAAMGYATVEESARAIIAERLASGASRRRDLPAFAWEILHRDIEKYRRQPHTSDWVFFDRGVIDALGMLQEVAPLPARELGAMLSTIETAISTLALTRAGCGARATRVASGPAPCWAAVSRCRMAA